MIVYRQRKQLQSKHPVLLIVSCYVIARISVPGRIIKVLVPLLQIAYAIGIAEPVSIHIDTYGTGARSDSELLTIIKDNFDLRPGIIVR